MPHLPLKLGSQVQERGQKGQLQSVSNAAYAAVDAAPLSQTEDDRCYHCHLPFDGKRHSHDDKEFCCRGCLSVYQLIKGSGLEHFYQLSPDSEKGVALKQYNEELRFVHFDRGDEREKHFFLEGVHCLACLWLIESAPRFVPGLKRVRLNMANSQVLVELDDEGAFSMVAQWFNRMGYYPHLLKDEAAGERLYQQENRSMLKRIGVAGFSAGNIMLLAVSIYGGADGEFFTIFAYLSALMYLPAILYSAQPFFVNAYKKTLQRQLSLDLPVSIILVLGSAVSFAKVFVGSEHFYFDSLAVFIFLLLGARFFLKRVQQRHSKTKSVEDLVCAEECLKLINGRFETVQSTALVKGDTIRLAEGSKLPCDVEITKGKALLDTAFLTGEHIPRSLGPGDVAPAGAMILRSTIEGTVLRTLEHSEMGGILRSIESSWGESGAEVQAACACLMPMLFCSSFFVDSCWPVAFPKKSWKPQAVTRCPCKQLILMDDL